MTAQPADASTFYRRYLTRCNEHRFDDPGEFAAADVSGLTDGLERYIASWLSMAAAQ